MKILIEECEQGFTVSVWKNGDLVLAGLAESIPLAYAMANRAL